MSSREEIVAADKYCRFLANRHYENFSVASLILPATARTHLARIYAFCRSTDDFGDESQGDGLARLQAWQEQVVSCFHGGSEPTHPVLIALRQTIAARRLEAKPFLDLIAANVQDQTVSSYDTWEELIAYCRCSAAPVGRMVLGVFGIREARAEAASDDVCIGLQLANFAQDVSVDQQKGRTYLVQSDIAHHGTRGAIQTMCRRAGELLASSRELEEIVPLRLRIQLALYRLGGGAILSAIRDTDYTTDLQRPHLSRLNKARLVPRAIQESTRRRMHVPAHHLV